MTAIYDRGVVRVNFTKNMQRHVDCPPEDVSGATLRLALDDYFRIHPAVRSYVLDDQGAVRRHVAVFVDGDHVSDPSSLSDPLGDDAEIHVMQALSGG